MKSLLKKKKEKKSLSFNKKGIPGGKRRGQRDKFELSYRRIEQRTGG
jgi:hypothetical protein